MRNCIGLILAALTQLTANAAAPPLQEFMESGGCKLRGSASSVARQKEIAAQGKVAWQGACLKGYIDGPGVLWHEGSVTEAGRTRRFMFLLSGNARAGQRDGPWTRESFNMFVDSSTYWTSVATINYLNGAAKGPAVFREVRERSGFSPPFRAFLATVDAELAARGKQVPGTARDPPSATTATVPQAVNPASAPQAAAPPPLSTPASRWDMTTTADAANAAPAAEQAPRSATGPVQLAARSPTGSELRESFLQPLAEPGRTLPPPAPPALPQQQLLQQRGACNIERINGESVREFSIEAPASQALQVIGWATDPRKSRDAEPPRIPEDAWIRFFDRGGGPGLLIDMPRNAERPDVARALGHPAHAKAGFRVMVEPGRLLPGEYSVAILQRIGSDLAVCSSTARLRLK